MRTHNRSILRAMVPTLPALAFLGLSLHQALIVLLIVLALTIAAFPFILPKASSVWRYSLWSVAAVVSVALVATNLSSGGKTDRPGPPVVVKRVETAHGNIIWAANNVVEEFAPSSGQLQAMTTLPDSSFVADLARSPRGDDFALSFSPDTNGILRVSDLLKVMDLYLLPAGGRSPQLLLSHEQAGGGIGHPTWSMDGKYIYVAVTSGDPSASSIVRVSLADESVTPIGQQASEPSCSPDGRKLVFVRSQLSDGYVELWESDLDGAHAKAIKGGRFPDIVSPVVSPDGKTIAFSAPYTPSAQGRINPRVPFLGPSVASAHGGNWEVWTIPIDGGTARVHTAITENRPIIVWSPAGDELAVNADLGIYLVDVAQNRASLFALNTGSGLVWSP